MSPPVFPAWHCGTVTLVDCSVVTAQDYTNLCSSHLASAASCLEGPLQAQDGHSVAGRYHNQQNVKIVNHDKPFEHCEQSVSRQFDTWVIRVWERIRHPDNTHSTRWLFSATPALVLVASVNYRRLIASSLLSCLAWFAQSTDALQPCKVNMGTFFGLLSASRC